MEKKNWVLLRGIGHEREHWGVMLDELQETFPQDLFLPLDISGTGVHCKQTASLSVTSYREQIRDEALKMASPPFVLMGLSLGAMVLYDWARHYPKEVDCLIMINSSLGRYSLPWQRLRFGVWCEMIKADLNPDPLEKELGILRAISEKKSLYGPVARQRMAIMEKHPVTNCNKLRQLVAAARYLGSDSAPSVPILLLSSLGDRLCDPICSVQMQSKWKALHKVHPWAGHDLSLDDPYWVLDKLRAFLHRNG